MARSPSRGRQGPESPPDRAGRRRRYGWLAVVVLLGAGQAYLLGTRFAFFGRLEGWFWGTTHRPVVSSWALACVLLGAGLAWLATTRRGTTAAWLLSTWATACALQFALALTEGRGLDRIADRMLASGHGMYATDAARLEHESLSSLVRNYESRVGRELNPFASTKPPGQLLLYWMSHRLANIGNPARDVRARVRRHVEVATWTWTATSMLTLIPLFFLTRRWVGPEAARPAAALYAVVPAAQLMNLHADQAFFPLWVAGTLALCARAVTRDSDGRVVAYGAAAGVVAYAALFCTFGLLMLGPLALGLLLTLPGPTLRRRLLALAGGAGGALAAAAFARLAWSYDLPLRYQRAMAAHEAMKRWHTTAHDVMHFAWLNSFEFAWWIGLPLFALALAGACFAAVRRPALVLLGVLFLLAFFGHTKAETGRLWLPLAPMFCLAAAASTRAWIGGRSRWVWPLLVVQCSITMLMKVFQDFS